MNLKVLKQEPSSNVLTKAFMTPDYLQMEQTNQIKSLVLKHPNPWKVTEQFLS